jgi:hypothetical protein
MALVLADRVQETTATTGTGTLTLSGAVSGYQSFAVVGNGNTCYYTIVNGSAWEVGIGTYSTTGPTLARTIVLSNSDGNTSAITLVGASVVFLTYPAEKSVNLDASGNVSPLGTVASGTWQGTTVGVAYGGTGVTASSGANSVVLRDSNQNITANNINLAYQGIATTGGTTTFTAATPYYTQFTGSSNQTLVMPDATTLPTGATFIVDNDSTGTVTVKNGAGSSFETIIPGGVHNFVLESNATVAGTWVRYSSIPYEVEWGTNSLQLNTTVITGGTWQGGTIAGGYGGTGLTSFVAANNALYSTGATTLTAGTLPVAAGGTGITSLTSGYIPYGNGTSGYSSSASLQFNGTYLVVGGTTPLGGATNPITAFSSTANNYVQTYVYNASTGTSASADFVAYADNSTDAHGWADMGFTSSTYADPVYTVTGPNEAYVFGSALNSSYTGNLVYATDSTGSANAHQWYVGGFTQAKSAWKMQLTSTGLQLANALATSYGGTGSTSTTYCSLTTNVTGTLPVANGGTGNTSGQAASVANALSAGTGMSYASGTTFDGSAARTLNLANTAVTAGSYTYASITVDAQGRLTSASSGAAPSAFPTGTKMLFAQTAAPTGWTKDTTNYNDYALRVVTGTASSGGTVNFSTAFASQAVSGTNASTTATNNSYTPSGSVGVSGTVGGTTLDTSTLPSHNHRMRYTDIQNYTRDPTYNQNDSANAWDSFGYDGLATSYTGSSASHSHSFSGSGSFTGSAATITQASHTHTFTGTAINLAVKYLDVILASKD